ncbi:hypothetical protein F4781DRAFT_37599 [Annulohypoxylon bovei var. microspora]|nr:hypothetical protein F4781DRAFT_37599 [Annulohypoxylon bovei var. microspora]
MLSQLYQYILGILRWPLDSWATTSNRSTFERFADQNNQLAALWQRPDRYTIIFVGIYVRICDRDPNKITEIELSTWCPSRQSSVDCLHWKIRENIDNETSRYKGEDNFVSNDDLSKVVSESSIRSLLNHFFEVLGSHFQTISLVGHDIESVLDPLKTYWTIPESIILLDTQKIWQFQHQQTYRISLEQALYTMLGMNYKNMPSAGNNARHILKLLQYSGQATEKNWVSATRNIENFTF